MERTMMETAASLGYAVWAPDYAGMGDGEGFQEYCVPESMAASALDGLTAARSYVSSRGAEYAETGRLAILGYSQGGFAVMAALAAVTDGLLPVPGLDIIAAYPMGAPLNLMAGPPINLMVGASVLTSEPAAITWPNYQLLLILGWARAYPDVVRIDEILLPSVIENILPLFDGERDGDELCRLIARAVGKKTDEVLDTDLYLPAYVSAMRKAPETVPYYSIQNETRLDRWTPPSGIPIVIAASPDDEVVRFLNSQSAWEWMTTTNPDADVSLVRLASTSHGRAAVEGLLYAIVDLDRRDGLAAASTAPLEAP